MLNLFNSLKLLLLRKLLQNDKKKRKKLLFDHILNCPDNLGRIFYLTSQIDAITILFAVQG